MKKIVLIILVFAKYSVIAIAQTTTPGSTIYTSDANGFVGIKTTTPVSQLHVQGRGSFGDSVTTANATRSLNLVDDSAVMRIIRVHETNAPSVELISRKTKDGSNVAYWDLYTQPSDASFRIRERKGGGEGNNWLKIATNGNVGIGTMNTTEKLSVNGNIRAHKIIISLTGWPDYVFNKNYKLRSLNSLEAFINKNNHLPGVPSTYSVEKKGLDVGSAQSILLRKIEELTLYVIELNKKNQKLQQRIKKLERK